MKFLVTWTDTRTGAQHKLELHNRKSLDIVLSSLRNAPRYADVAVRERIPRRINEIVILLQS